MEYKSDIKKVLKALETCKFEFAQGVGTLAVAEVQPLVPVLSGNLKKSITYDLMPNDDGVNVGVNLSAPYGLYVEKGIGQKAQPFLEPGCMQAIPKIINVAEQIYKQKMGGK